jgi:hypothetical protein
MSFHCTQFAQSAAMASRLADGIGIRACGGHGLAVWLSPHLRTAVLRGGSAPI